MLFGVHFSFVKHFHKGLPYYPPLTEPTMRKIFSSVFGPFSFGQSSTFLVARGFGGGRALLRFLLLNVDEYARKCNLHVSSATHAYVYVEPDLLREESAEAYEKLVFSSVGDVVSGEKSLRSYDINSLQKLIWQFIEKKEIVIVFAGMSFLSFTDRRLWSRIRHLKVYPERVHFLFVVYDGGPVSMDDSRFGRIKDIMIQNVLRIYHLSSKDIEYSIDRWAYALGCVFTGRERKEIRRMSLGRPSLLKANCFAVAKNKARKLRADSSIYPNTPFFRMNRAIYLCENESSLISGKILEQLSIRECEVLRELIHANGKTVARHEIASFFWETEGKPISDGAITQLICRLRKKLKSLKAMNIKIASVYGCGYRLEK